MRVYVLSGNAFIKNGDTFLCIGTEAEVSKATPCELARMVSLAMAIAKFENMPPGRVH